MRPDELMQMVFEAQGFVVLADPDPPDVQVGECLSFFQVSGHQQAAPLVVIGEATADEFVAQCKLLRVFAQEAARYVKVVAE